MNKQTTSETEKVREALATRISGFPLIAPRDDTRNLLARESAKHDNADRFTSPAPSLWGAL